MQRKKIQISNFFFKKSVSHVSICGGLDLLSLVRLGLYLLEYASLKGSGLESTKEMWREEEKQQLYSLQGVMLRCRDRRRVPAAPSVPALTSAPHPAPSLVTRAGD